MITPSVINGPQKLEHILRSSIYTGYHIFGDVKSVQIAASIGPLLCNNMKDKNKLSDEYKQTLEIIAPSIDILFCCFL